MRHGRQLRPRVTLARTITAEHFIGRRAWHGGERLDIDGLGDRTVAPNERVNDLHRHAWPDHRLEVWTRRMTAPSLRAHRLAPWPAYWYDGLPTDAHVNRTALAAWRRRILAAEPALESLLTVWLGAHKALDDWLVTRHTHDLGCGLIFDDPAECAAFAVAVDEPRPELAPWPAGRADHLSDYLRGRRSQLVTTAADVRLVNRLESVFDDLESAELAGTPPAPCLGFRSRTALAAALDRVGNALDADARAALTAHAHPTRHTTRAHR